MLECRSARRSERGPSGVACTQGGDAVTTRGVVAAAALIASALLGAGCADLRKTFSGMWALSTALQAQFQEPFVVTRTTNGVLILSAQAPEAEAEKVVPGIDRERALRIAKFARAHYTDTIGLHAITVFFTTRNDVGALHIQHSHPGGTWSIIALDAEPDPELGDSAGQSAGIR